MDSIDAQAQSALALLRGSEHNYATQWSTYLPHLQSIQGYVSQLLNGGNVGGGTTDIPAPEPIQANPPAQSTTQGQIPAQTTVTGTAGVKPTGFNLGLADSIAHIGFQFLLVLVAIALLLGGIYLLGSRK
jgi:chitinase